MQWSNGNNKRNYQNKAAVKKKKCQSGPPRNRDRKIGKSCIGESESRNSKLKQVYIKSAFAFKSGDTINVCLPKSK